MQKQNNIISTNHISITGKIVSGIIYDHEVYGEKFYITFLESKRKSGESDVLRLVMREHQTVGISIGCTVKVSGKLRSHNVYDQTLEKYRLKLSIAVNNIDIITESSIHKNELYLDGILCREPKYRVTPLNREITDVLLVVGRPKNRKSDYIPLVIWGRRARMVSSMKIGAHIALKGRFQSRKYIKRFADGSYQICTAYEVSVLSFEEILV